MQRVLFGLLLVIFSFATALEAATAKTAVFFVPHQDDEMYMLGSIHRQLAAGDDVYVVLATDGGNSQVRKELAKELKRKITRREFVSWRNKEFYRSLRSIGVEPTHVIFANDGGIMGSMTPNYQDGKLTYEQAFEIIQNFYKNHGDGMYATVLADGGHGDHRMFREALESFIGVNTKQYYSEVVDKGEHQQLTKEERAAKAKAMAIYYDWDPKNDHYAIAKHSVKKLLDFWRWHGIEYVSSK